MQVFELRETPQPYLVMEYYERGNIVKAYVAYDEYVTAIGRILDGLTHLHAKNIARSGAPPPK